MQNVAAWHAKIKAGLPIPAPLATAVEAGLFGIRSDGTLRPGAREIVSITTEQAQELIALRLEQQRQRELIRATTTPARGLRPRSYAFP